MRVRFLPLLALVFPFIWSYKILIYNPRFGHSHSQFLGRIADTLVEAGHNVTSLIPIMNPSIKDGTQLSHKIFVEPDPEVKRIYETPSRMNAIERNLFNPLSTISVALTFSEIIGLSCAKLLNEPGLLERLREEEYDVYIAENCVVCGIGIFKAIKAKTAIGAASSCLYGPELDEYGTEQAISYRSTLFHSSFDVHSFRSRLLNIFGEILLRVQFDLPRLAAKRALSAHFGPLYPTVEYWEGVLARRPHTILISFGSVVNSYLLPLPIKMSILKSISRFPDITFIWKYEKIDDEFSREHAVAVDNLVLTEWMPQNGILSIFIPIFGDQPRNARMMEINGLGTVMDKFELNDAEKLTAKISEIVENPKYRKNSLRISRMIAAKPFTARDTLVKYVEFAAEFGASSALRPQSHDMSFVEYHNLDVAVVLLVASVIGTVLTVKTALLLKRSICSLRVKTKVQ